MSRCDLVFWPVDLESSWPLGQVIKVCTKFERSWAIPGGIIYNFANFCTRYVTLWPWPLAARPSTFKDLLASGVYCVNYLQNLNEIEWSTTELSTIELVRHVMLWGGAFLPNGSQGALTQLHQIWHIHRAIIRTQEVCISVRIPWCIFKRRRLQIE